MIAGIIMSLAGGLALFLFGMHVMSEGIEQAAGAKMRSILEFFTTNRFTGMIVGFFFTAVIQSSSACTALVVAFVNSGLMSLSQAVGVILGSNIGTTVTSQLVSFNLSAYAPAISLIGVVCLLFIKKSFAKKIGTVLIGFGVLFMGLTNMKDAMSGIKEMPIIANAFSSLTNPVLAILLGLVVTSIVQSSSVTVSITLLMASQGLLGLPICLYIILGCNIGACSTAMLASLSGNKMAKRAALIHLLFNVFGTIIMFVILQFTMDYVVYGIEAISGGDMGRCVANAHTIFKIFQVLILFPFGGGLVKLTYLLVPGEDEKIGYRANMQLKYIGGKNIFSPATAVIEVIKELDRMATLASENLNRAMNALITLDDDDIEEVYEVEQNINYLNKEITHYLVKISQTNLPVEDAKSIGALFHVVNDIERIGDHAENAADAAKQRQKDGSSFSPAAMREMGELLDMVNTIIRFAIEMFTNNDETHLHDVQNLEEAIDEKEREIQQSHVERMASGECSAEAGMIFSDIISGLERVADHAVNIAFCMHDNA
ncbi:MAG: Na/Pi cotransporter family protein [Lachnospiraceae bacterium]|nr:Na/Pi cotransporter family protein [Lachnospiraceae bacterium]